MSNVTAIKIIFEEKIPNKSNELKMTHQALPLELELAYEWRYG